MSDKLKQEPELPGNSLLGNSNFEGLNERGSSTLWFSIVAVMALIAIGGIAAFYFLAH